MEHFDIAVVGGGLAGSLAALSLAGQGRRIALVAPVTDTRDERTTALMDHSLQVLRRMEIWDELARHSAPLSTMRIIDGTERLIRTPTVTFRSAEIDLPAFGYNIPNAAFLSLLEENLGRKSSIRRFAVTADTISWDAPNTAVLSLADGTVISAALVVGADGRKSRVRETAAIAARTWSYPQSAVVLNFSHRLGHENISTEFHTPDGPFTQVPLPGNRSSLVWVRKPEDAAALLEMPLEQLSFEVEKRMQSMLGKVTVDTRPRSFPLSGLNAAAFGKGRTVLIGEAAHAFPPIGAQGLNLSLRDIEALESLLSGVSTIPDDIGALYDRRRRADITTRTIGVDLLNRSLLSDFLPVQMLRASGLQALASVGPLRSLMMREGLAPGSAIRAIRNGLREKIGRQRA